MLVLRNSKSGQREWGGCQDRNIFFFFFLLASQTEVPRISSHRIHVCPPSPSPSLWGFTSMCLHCLSPLHLLVQAEHWNFSSRLVLQPWVRISFFSLLFPSSPGLTLMWNALAHPLGSTVCTVFFA